MPEWARRVGVVPTSSKTSLLTSRKLRADPVMTRSDSRLLPRIGLRFFLFESASNLRLGFTRMVSMPRLATAG